jgi:hypothetical protein
MNCSRFSEILADFQEGKLLPGEQSAAEAHVGTCSACRRLLDIIRGGIAVLPEDREDELARSILDRTCGPVCSHVESQLWDFAGGELGEEDSQLLILHLEHCAGCRSVAGDLAILQEELPAMSEIEPGASFTSDVVRITSGGIPDQSGFAKRLQACWNLLVQRPLFSYEAAYVGTLVVILAFSPFLPFREFALEKMLSAVVQPSANYLHSVWAETKAPVSDRLYKLASAVESSDKPVSESLSKLVKTCGDASASILNRSINSVSGWSRELIRNSKFENK